MLSCFVCVMSRAWKDTFRTKLDKRMHVTGCEGGEKDDELKCTIDMFGVHFILAMESLYDDYYHLTWSWDDGTCSYDAVDGENVSKAIGSIVEKTRDHASKKTHWKHWQQYMVNVLCDRGVVPGITGQVAEEKYLKLQLSKDGSSFYVEIHFGDVSNVSYTFVPCANPSICLIRQTWNAHPPNLDTLVRMIIEDLGKAPAIEKGVLSPIHTGPGSETAGSGAATRVGGGSASSKLRVYEAIVDLLLSVRGRDIPEETVNSVSDLLREVKETLDTHN
jgi:hypothetical protein